MNRNYVKGRIRKSRQGSHSQNPIVVNAGINIVQANFLKNKWHGCLVQLVWNVC